jgi:hypothetical protein
MLSLFATPHEIWFRAVGYRTNAASRCALAGGCPFLGVVDRIQQQTFTLLRTTAGLDRGSEFFDRQKSLGVQSPARVAGGRSKLSCLYQIGMVGMRLGRQEKLVDLMCNRVFHVRHRRIRSAMVRTAVPLSREECRGVNVPTGEQVVLRICDRRV